MIVNLIVVEPPCQLGVELWVRLRRQDMFRGRVTTIVDMPDRIIDLLFRFLHQNEGRLSKRAREQEFDALTNAEAEQIERMYQEIFGDPPEIRSMKDLHIALHNREVAWPPRCEKGSDGRHRIAKVAPKRSEVHEGWTYQGVCGLCGEMVDTGEPYDR